MERMNLDGLTLPDSADPEYRRDPVTGNWMLLASERARRPIRETVATSPVLDIQSCPFCEGNEDQTPPEVLAVRPAGGPADTGGWNVRVVPNRYPATRMGLPDVDPQRVKSSLGGTCAGLGRHEVVIERPDHHWTISDLSDEHVTQIFDVYRQRLRFLRTKRPLRYAMIFKNVGQAAGASQEHVHSQILATSTLPARIEEEVNGSERYYQRHSRCVFCDMIQWELSQSERVVEETTEFFVWCPYASRFPFELWVIPKVHSCRFEDIPMDDLGPLGELLRSLLIRMEMMAGSVAYNYYVHTAPFAAGCDAYYHWHLEITPRLLGLAGFELGAGMFINTVPPEWAAKQWQMKRGA